MCVSITRCFYSKSSSSFYCSVSPPTAAAIERCDLPISRTPGCFRHSPGSPTISSLFPHTCFKCTFSPLNLHKHRSSSCLTISHLFLTFPLHPSHPRLLFCSAVPRSTYIRSTQPWPTTLLPCNMDEPNTINTKSVDRECYV